MKILVINSTRYTENNSEDFHQIKRREPTEFTIEIIKKIEDRFFLSRNTRFREDRKYQLFQYDLYDSYGDFIGGGLLVADKDSKILSDSYQIVNRLTGIKFTVGANSGYYSRLANYSYHHLQTPVANLPIKDLVSLPQSLEKMREIESLNQYISEYELTEIFPKEIQYVYSIISEEYKNTTSTRGGSISVQWGDSTISFDPALKNQEINGLWAIAGKNGSGKTKLLSDVAHIHISDIIHKRKGQKLLYISINPFEKKLHKDISFAAMVGRVKTLTARDFSKTNHRKFIDENFILSYLRNRENINYFLSILKQESAFSYLIDSFGVYDTSFNYKEYNKLSTGHKIVLSTIFFIAAQAEDDMILLFDEPENYLHPPLVQALINAISAICEDKNGISIIATHSPIVLQVIRGENVWVLGSGEKLGSAYHPTIETFGSSLSIINDYIFNLDNSNASYYRRIENYIDQGLSKEDILGKFGNKLGDKGLYVLNSKLLQRDESDVR